MDIDQHWTDNAMEMEAALDNLTPHITKTAEYPVARGGFGEVWKCLLQSTKGPVKVAVKAFQMYSAAEAISTNAKNIKRIRRELGTSAGLRHPNVLRVYGYSLGFGPLPAIVTPWVEQGNLSGFLEREGLSLTTAHRFKMLRAIASGLQYLHTNNIVHGDLTGPNVLIHGDGSACVADFGLSLLDAPYASWTSRMKGNLRWMAPELLRDDYGTPVRPTKRSDIYSFGGVMLQVITGDVPFHYLPEFPIVLMKYNAEIPSRVKYPSCNDAHWNFIEECWSTDPLMRPSVESVVTFIGR
ncbi:kinase-like domain-containing protein [Suillus subalutaceus]|uniref:kinase-like domain-containing protein n=1 Tax=Suillus subalutaceus TaxID=48586 RepID=UPI001B872EFD|nr:kinase-like domain-containing protein [Suillus subalutaceus]XP_041246743.1 kinase-like domain-containing protein [Suillus subalutaceus]KAG1863252.1 kinase-like domain-containing protein [Suillus subalutaceus]KAG1863276.1 kinase-like domain-containing protein [Suillus subalutaceus]